MESLIINPFQPSAAFHKETSQLKNCSTKNVIIILDRVLNTRLLGGFHRIVSMLIVIVSIDDSFFRIHSFSTCVKFSEKLTFLTP